MRLLEFNSEQQAQWINIWNSVNEKYFRSQSPPLKPFALPKREKGRKNSILELAEQPLLLLMLALYDSEGNSLAKLQTNLKRTVLYENLLRRFIRRERSRYIPDFNHLTSAEQEKFIDVEMNRLGVVAMGMYNRKKLYINTKELDTDLAVFELAQAAQGNRKLKDSEALLGGFFFIHQSTAQDISAGSDHSESAFEFLHNTFGEFLTADIILKYAVQETCIIKTCDETPALSTELTRKMNTPDGLCSQWFNCLMFTPLFSRPVILEMIAEHVEEVIKANNITRKDFVSYFHKMLMSQLKNILELGIFPKVMTDEKKYIGTPLLGSISIYTLNLIILASVLSDDAFVFDESFFTKSSSRSETAPWDKLTFLWRTWFSSENLTGLSVIIKSVRKENKIYINRHEKYEARSIKDPINIQLSVSNTLADHLNAGLAGLHTDNFSEIVMLPNEMIADFWENKNSEIYFSFLVTQLRKAKYSMSHREDCNAILERIIDTVKLENATQNTLSMFLEVIEACCSSDIIHIYVKKKLFSFLVRYWETTKQLNDSKLIEHLYKTIRLVGNDSMMLISDRTISSRNLLLRAKNYIYNDGALYRNFREDRVFRERLFYDSDIIKAMDGILSDDSKYTLQEIKDMLDEVDLMEIAMYDTELVSRYLLRYKHLAEQYGRTFIEFVISYLNNEDICFIGYITIINTVKLAKLIDPDAYLPPIVGFLRYNLLEVSSEHFSIILVCHPEFISELIKAVPEIFVLEDSDMQLLGETLLQRMHTKIPKKSIFAFIKLLRCVYRRNMCNISDYTIANVAKMIFRNFNFSDLHRYSIEEISDIFWLAKITNNRSLSAQINKMMSLE